MHYFNRNNKNNHVIVTAATAATISTLAIIFASSSMTATPVRATTTASNITTATTAATTTSFSSGIELSPQSVYQERSPEPNITPIIQTHETLTFSGNGILTLPNTTQTINTTSNGTSHISFTTSSGYAMETIRREDGSETGTVTFYEIVQFNTAASEGGSSGGKGIVTAVFQTNSTGMLAPLNV
jgi:hypothetical protein